MKFSSIRFEQSSLAEAMDTRTVLFFVNIKAIFCLALLGILTNLVFTQNLYTSPLDDTRNALMSFSSGAGSTKPSKRPAWHLLSSRMFRALLNSPSLSLFYFTLSFVSSQISKVDPRETTFL